MTGSSAGTTTRTAADPAVRAASRGVFVVFVLNGFNFSSWAARLPAVRDGLGLAPSQIGVLLLIGSIGSLLALPLSGLLVTRLGAPRTVLGFAILNASGLTLASVGVATGQVVVVGLGLVMFGVGTGVWDATMAAAGVAAIAAWLRVPVVVHLPVVLALTTLGVAWAVREFLPTAASHGAPTHAGEPTVHAPSEGRMRRAFGAWLEGRTLLIGLVVLAAALTEGSANDWVALAVVDGFGKNDAIGALTFGLFVTAMTAMRFLGTRLLDRYGRVVVLRLCSGLALAGLLLFALVSEDMMWLALVGVVLWGMGAALGFPVGMSAASDDPLRAAARLSVVSTIGYSAFLAGPPLLGMLAQHVGYRHALLAIAVPVVVGLGVIRAAAPVRANLTQ
jgi:MFS family permease